MIADVVTRSHTPSFSKRVRYLGWIMLLRSLMLEEGLGKVMSGAEKVPPDLEDAAPSDTAVHAPYNRSKHEHEE